MNTKNNITPLADLISRVERWHKITGIQAGTQGLDRDINELKSKAKAEYAALVAAAEAAQADNNDGECYCGGEGINFRGPCGHCLVKHALANLETILNQK